MRTWIIIIIILVQQAALSQSMKRTMPSKEIPPQNRIKIDSLKSIIETGKLDTTQIIRMCLLSDYYAVLKNDSGLIYSRKALSLAEEINNAITI